MAYTKNTLQQDLAAMGLTGTETILIHSSMKSIGAVEGGADTVLDALMEYFAKGLLLLPTHTWRFGDAKCILCDANALFRVTRHVLAPNPEAFITEPVIPAERWKAISTPTT